MHVRTEGDKSVFSSAKFETFANLVGVKASYHHYFSFSLNIFYSINAQYSYIHNTNVVHIQRIRTKAYICL